ncbi:hypothetical protein KKH27_03815 [bacterium]|nr:hypothetical protein [bacterium]MBU1985061.1 hypothetical protein [bacterium]
MKPSNSQLLFVDRLALLLFGVVLVFLFWRGLWIEPAGDDWLLLTPVREMVRETGVAGAIGQAFTYPIIDQFYRPLALLPQFLITDKVLLAQLLKLLVQLGFFLVVRRTARDLGIPSPWSSVVAAIPLLHQVFTSVLTEIDLWGDQLSALAFVVLFLIALRFDNGRMGRFAYVVAMVSIAAGCVLAKEAGVTSFITPLGFAIVSYLRRNHSVVGGHVVAASATVGVIAVYLVIRHALGIDTQGPQEGYYSLSVGANLLTNSGLAALALLSPVNTVEVAIGPMFWKFMAALWVMGWLGIAAIGMKKSVRTKTWHLPALLFVLALAAQGPVFFMPHLTEANFTRSLALGWLGMALLIKGIIGTEHKRRALVILLTVSGIWFVFDIQAVLSKTRDIEVSQAQASRFRRELLAQVTPFYGDTLFFALEDPGYLGYSVYRQPFLVDAREGELTHGLRDLFKKPDLRVEWFETPSTDQPDTLVADFYVKRNGQVVPAGMRLETNSRRD